MIKAIPFAVVGYAIWLLAGKDEGGYLSVLAGHFVAEDLITAGERTALPSLRVRRLARKQVKKQHGRKAAKAVRSLQREQVRLVMYHGRHGAGPGRPRRRYSIVGAACTGRSAQTVFRWTVWFTPHASAIASTMRSPRPR